jgi:hypothetical protein
MSSPGQGFEMNFAFAKQCSTGNAPLILLQIAVSGFGTKRRQWSKRKR